MPCSLLVYGYPYSDVSAASVQGAALQGMFLHLMEHVQPGLSARLHEAQNARPYTLSPLGIGTRGQDFRAFRLPKDARIAANTPCFFRVTLLDDTLLPLFANYFFTGDEPTFRLGETDFGVNRIQIMPEGASNLAQCVSYPELCERVRQTRLRRRLTLRFMTPTCFSKGDLDVPLPIPRLVFQGYQKRLQAWYPLELLPEFPDLVDQYVGVAQIDHFRTDSIRTKRVVMAGFIGDVTFLINENAPNDLFWQIALLAEFALFCGTGKKTTMGMGQTAQVRLNGKRPL